MLKSPPNRLLRLSLSWLTRLAIVVSAGMAVLIAVAIIALRYYLLPDIEQYHDRITASLATAIGNSVTIGKIEGEWQGLQPHLDFTDVRILDEQQQPALVLPVIKSSVSWMSLFSAELRLASLEIVQPELLIRRDAQGKFFIGGIALSKQDGEKGLSDLLLHQSRMVVRDALVVWVDELRAAPPLVLQQVNLRIESFFGRHRFALRALPPPELSTPLDVRGDFQVASLDDISDWRGQLFTQLDYTDVMAWRPWLDLPGEFSRGRGALRGWLGIKHGKVVQIAADLDLHDVVTRLAKDQQELVLLDLRGRTTWQEVDDGFEISTRRLAMRLQNGNELRPTDFYFRARITGDGHFTGGEIRANQLQLETLSALSRYLPLEEGLRSSLETYGPSGKVSNLDLRWQGALEQPDGYEIKARFTNLGLRQVGKMPGFSGLTADVDCSDTGGRLSINARQLFVEAPGELREPLSFATLTGQATWQRRRGELSINVSNIAVANEDLAGNLYGSYQTQAGTRGVLDLTAKLTRGDIRRAARYTPLVALHKEGNDWLNGALLAGHTEDFRIRIKGNLSDFPLDGTRDVIFMIGGHARDAVLEFDKNWPRIENITGEFLINGNKLEVKSPSANMLGAHLQNVSVTLPDMMSADLALEIRGEAEAASNEFLRFIQLSPVRGYIDGFTDGLRASGNSHLALFVRVPLQGNKPVQVSGNIRVQKNDIGLGDAAPLLRNTRGVLSFTESGMQASGVSAEILGGPASINLQTGAGGEVHASVQGRSDLDELRKIQTHPLLDYLHGRTEWDADIRVMKKSAQVIVKSDLRGISSSLPQPFTKPDHEAMPVRIEKSAASNGNDLITVHLGKLLNARLARHEEKGAMVIRNGTIVLGEGGLEGRDRPVAARGREGVWLAGRLPVLSIQGWERLAGSAGSSGSALPIAGASLLIDKLEGYGLGISSLRIDAARRGEAVGVKLASTALSGDLVWQPHGYEMQGKLSARLLSLHLVDDDQPSISNKPETSIPPDRNIQPDKTPPLDSNVSQLHPDDLPALDIAIEDLQLKGKRIGRLELVGHPDGNDWRMRRLRITNPDGSLMGDGIWYGAASKAGSNIATFTGKADSTSQPGTGGRDGSHSQLNLLLEISDAGQILVRSGYPNTVKGGSGKLVADLSWSGSPDEFNYASLNGTLKLDTGKGRFVKMEPGVGKLLSILSLQALPKHITLDFNDVFSEGFQFDNINGNATIKNGLLDSQDFHIDGSSAKVTLKGSVDLNNETQSLRVRVLPTIGDTVSLIGAFAAGPAVGVGALILNKVLGDPLDKLVSFEYNVSGTWSDPNVVKVARIQPQRNNTSE
ncbi:MAG: YhdP family protein [Gallionella sp.]